MVLFMNEEVAGKILDTFGEVIWVPDTDHLSIGVSGNALLILCSAFFLVIYFLFHQSVNTDKPKPA